MKKRYMSLVILLLLVNIITAVSITDDLHLNIQTTSTAGSVVTGTFDFIFNISDDSNCASVVYTHSTTLTTDSRGIISYYLSDVSLDYDKQYWLCYYRDGTLMNISKIARTPYAFRAKNVTLSGVEVDSNLNLNGYNLSADNSEFNGGWLNDGVSIIGGSIYAQVGYFYNITSLNVTKQSLTILDNLDIGGNISASYFIGDGSLLTGITSGLWVNSTPWTYLNSIYNQNVNISNVMFISSPYVGIGTSTPAYNFEVNGTMNVSTSNVELRVNEDSIKILI